MRSTSSACLNAGLDGLRKPFFEALKKAIPVESSFGKQHREFGSSPSPYVERRTDGNRDTVTLSQKVMSSPGWMLQRVEQ
jgi:hypothetical protein